MSQKLTSLLVKARKADASSVKTIRREFNTGELTTIRDTPWGKYELNKDDLNKLEQIKHLVGPVLKERKRKKKGKKARAVRQLKHHAQQHDVPEIEGSVELVEENVYDEDLYQEFSNTEINAEILEIDTTHEVQFQAA
ncbi:MAG: hypothetical protein ACPHY8_03065 [Patescibacteria group bacterium]